MRVHLVGVDGDLMSLEDDRLLADHLSFLGCVTHDDLLWCLISVGFFLCSSLLLYSVDRLGRAHRIVVRNQEPRVSTYLVNNFTRLVQCILLVKSH